MSSQDDNEPKRRRFIVANDEDEMDQELANANINADSGETYERLNEEIPSDHSDVGSNPDDYGILLFAILIH